MTKTLWVTSNTYIMDSGLCVFNGLVGMLDIGIYGSLLVNKFIKWKTGDNVCLSGHQKGVNFDIFVVKNKRKAL